MIVTIELEEMEFWAGHGCYDIEKKVGNRYGVSLSLDAEVGDAARNDSLADSVNYVTVYEIVRREMAKPSDIIENVAYRILESVCGAFPQVVSGKVKVSKLAPPVGGKMERVSVTLTK